MNMQYSDMVSRFLLVICIMRPSVNLRGFRMAVKLEHLNDSLPHGLALECLFDWHALDVL